MPHQSEKDRENIEIKQNEIRKEEKEGEPIMMYRNLKWIDLQRKSETGKNFAKKKPG